MTILGMQSERQQMYLKTQFSAVPILWDGIRRNKILLLSVNVSMLSYTFAISVRGYFLGNSFTNAGCKGSGYINFRKLIWCRICSDYIFYTSIFNFMNIIFFD